MKTGLISESAEIYHADEEHHGSSHLKAMMISPAHYKSYVDGKKKISKSLKATFDIGTCAHSINLENDRSHFVVGPEAPTKAAKIWKDFVAEHPDKIVLTPNENADLEAMNTVWRNHSRVQGLMKDALIERSAYAIDPATGVKIKGRMDAIQGGIILDYKTTGLHDLSDRSIANEILNRGYHISAAHYMAVVHLAAGLPIGRYILIFQEKKVPFGIRVIELSPSFIGHGWALRENLLRQIEQAIKSNSFPCYPEDVTTLDLPKWAGLSNEVESEEEAYA